MKESRRQKLGMLGALAGLLLVNTSPGEAQPVEPIPAGEAPVPGAAEVPPARALPELPSPLPPTATNSPETPTLLVYRTTVTGSRPSTQPDEQRSTTRVELPELQRRLPASTPDALRYVPGVSIQQTASSQGSPYIRGLTGQQTVILFDGIRINNSLFRQGPNQYLFTIDTHVLRAIDVTRGSASVLFGSDALGGVVELQPLEPDRAPAGELAVRPRLFLRGGTADDEYGGRLRTQAAWGSTLGFLGGVGARRAGLLEGGGQLYGLDGDPALVPRLAADGRTQLGTGHAELTADGRLVLELTPRQQLTAATYVYRQYDAPRTDRCPSAFAPDSECLQYDEQFRTLAYLTWAGQAPASTLFRRWKVTTSYQRQHERRTQSRPASFVENGGRDDVDTFGFTARGGSRVLDLTPELALGLQYGADGTLDRIGSAAWNGFTDIDLLRFETRGQYIDGSSYLAGGAFAQGELLVGRTLTVRAGGRGSLIRAAATEDPESLTRPIDRHWQAAVGQLGLRYEPIPGLQLLLNADQGFRAPNLDDLTGRLQVGPGFQMENAELQPERSLTLEAGVKLARGPVTASGFGYRLALAEAIGRRPIPVDECPTGPGGAGCRSSWNRFQLVNAGGSSEIYGLDGEVRLDLPVGFELRATLAYAWGEGPSLSRTTAERVPLSRIPPLQGTGELIWTRRCGAAELYVGSGVRWATAQDRLAVADYSDHRIPPGGTPGYLVADGWLGFRYDPHLRTALHLENLTDEVYRVHGSSINGPARSLVLEVEAGW